MSNINDDAFWKKLDIIKDRYDTNYYETDADLKRALRKICADEEAVNSIFQDITS